jgi:hypothetical protein
MEMDISLASSRRLNGFKQWSNDHPQSSNDDVNPDGAATPIALGKPPSDGEAPKDPPYRPWAVPGVGGSF